MTLLNSVGPAFCVGYFPLQKMRTPLLQSEKKKYLLICIYKIVFYVWQQL